MGRRAGIERRSRAALAGVVFSISLAATPATAAERTALPKISAQFTVEAGRRTLNRPPTPPDAPDGYNWWYYDVVLRETSERSGITLTGWTKCYTTKDDTGCEDVRSNFRQLFGADRIPPGGALRLKRPAWVWADKNGGVFKVEARYWGRDDNGNKVEGGYKFDIKSD